VRRLRRDKPDSPNSDHLHGDLCTDADAGNNSDAASCAPGLDCLHGYHAELDHRAAAESAARYDDASADKSGRAACAGFTAGCGRDSGNRHVHDYHWNTCRKAVGTRLFGHSFANATVLPIARTFQASRWTKRSSDGASGVN
jgi:hypothetical protein